jgi:hypothetical protein
MSPGLTALYGKALLRQLPLVGASGGDTLPDTVLTLDDVEVDRDALREYDEVCGFRLSDAAPPTYLHVPAFPLAMELMTRGDFPFGVMGLVHIANRIEQQRAVRAGETVALRVHAEGLTDHDRGRQFDIVSEAFAAGGESIWLEHSTYLRREGGGSSGRRDSSSSGSRGAVWRIPGDAGRRYAAVSGDRNPIHLHGLAAKLFGQKAAIAHGMWTKARCVAALQGHLPAAFSVDVAFKLPVLLPATVAFSSWADGGVRRFALRDARSGRPHVEGSVSPSASPA